ncbi:MAG TPA: DUF1592 domain-containing protein [Vicinamibacterales bacterium]|nr:DUF1592 domain-containing protein [Vicinamibacterales bacterium]
MVRAPSALFFGVVTIALVAFEGHALFASHSSFGDATREAASNHQAVLNRHCVTCHNRQLKTGGLELDTLDLQHVDEHAAVWERVVTKLRGGVMPPPGRPRPDAAAYDALASFLEMQLDRAAVVNPNPGRTETLHRLNRAEYRNAIRDLLALDIDVESLLPADGSSYGFDNIAGVQRMSPRLLERYLTAAQKVSRVALGTIDVPAFETFRLVEDAGQDERLEGLPFGTRGGTLIRYNFPVDGDYSIAVKLTRVQGSDIRQFDDSQSLEVSIDGRRIDLFTLLGRSAAAANGRRAPGSPRPDRRSLDANWRVQVPVEAGQHEVAVTFINRTPALLENFVEPFLRPIPFNQGYSTQKGAYIRDVEIAGPLSTTGGGNSPSRQRILVCHPSESSKEADCARTILLTLAKRAYRRPVSDEDIRPLMAFYKDKRASGAFEERFQLALQALLMSPEFIFRAEHAPANIGARAYYHVNDLDMATRLSFFLWSSLPDDELLDLAAKGKLSDPVVLDRQVRRMLADTRSQALVNSFASQWLSLRNVPAVAVDANIAPDFDEDLRQAFRHETELFFQSVVREDRSVIELLNANYTYVNERLARHYGIPNIYGTHFRRVTLTGDKRRGLLGQGSFLSVNASPNRTSPVLRGKWIMTNLLGTPPPDPPANVPALTERRNEPSDRIPSMRERMIEHRANPVCASCHRLMDPLGFALENFDLVGKWRDLDESWQTIDASGNLPDGTQFDGVVGLREALVSHSGQFVHTMTAKLLTYALGRGVEYYDEPAIRKVVQGAASQNYRFSSLILGTVHSLPFQMRRLDLDAQPNRMPRVGTIELSQMNGLQHETR